MAVRQLVAALILVLPAHPCDVVTIGKYPSPPVSGQVVKRADAIVRAEAVEYAERISFDAGGGPIRFRVLETLRGPAMSELVLPGELVGWDDFNRDPVPYNSGRPNSLSGSCVAWQYRLGSQFLLMLTKNKAGQFSVEFYPFAPVNEQLHSETDPWLLWVRAEVFRTSRHER